MVDVKKAELIEGMVIMPSPVSNTHSKANSLIVWWLVGYSAATPGVEVGENTTVRLDLDNEVQPDAISGCWKASASAPILAPPTALMAHLNSSWRLPSVRHRMTTTSSAASIAAMASANT